jgi:hypothetical protein
MVGPCGPAFGIDASAALDTQVEIYPPTENNFSSWCCACPGLASMKRLLD